jgi:hypothetical protein
MRPLLVLALLAGCGKPTLVVTGATAARLEAGDFAPLTVDGDRILDARGRQVILRGLQHHALQDVAYQGRAVLSGDHEEIAGWGFRALRLSISWSRVEPVRGSYDEAYLDALQTELDLFQQAGLYAIIEWHQDQYGRCTVADAVNNGNGAPDWACDQSIPRGAFAYLSQFDRLWRNDDTLFDAYVAAFAHVIDRVGAHPAVLGYDVFNEPYGSGGSPTFEQNALLPSYRALVPRLRAAGARGLLFLDAPGYRNESFQMATAPLADVDRDLVYAPHLYTSWLSLFLLGTSPSAESKLADFAAASMQASGLGLPWWNGEWGVNLFLDDWHDLAVRHVRLEEKYKVGSSYWAFEQATPNQGDASVSGGQSLLDEARNPRSDLVDVLSRPYPMQTPGTLDTFSFDFKTHTLDVAFDSDSTAPMVIYAPARHLTKSMCLQVSATGAAQYDYDAKRELVVLRFANAGRQALTLAPCGK